MPFLALRATRAAIIPVAAIALVSCTTAGSDISTGASAYESSTTTTAAGPTLALADEANPTAPAGTGQAAVPMPNARPDAKDGEAGLPTPTAADQAAKLDADEAKPEPASAASAEATAQPPASDKPADATVAAAKQPPSGDSPAPAAPASVNPAAAGDGSVATAAPAQRPEPKKTGIFALFGSKPQPARAMLNDPDSGGAPPAATRAKRPAMTGVGAQVARAAPAPELNMASLELPGASDDSLAKRRASLQADGGLPGVRKTALFEIKRRSGMDDDSDVDLYEDAPTVQLASVGGMARGLNGLLTQTESVDVACLKPGLVRVLKQIEAKFGRKMVVTSGYRSPSHNRRARGAKNSQHMYCSAADVQIPGVAKAELARYARSMPGRGGVGTYCHTESVHIDIGPERDWNWRCRGKRKG